MKFWSPFFFFASFVFASELPDEDLEDSVIYFMARNCRKTTGSESEDFLDRFRNHIQKLLLDEHEKVFPERLNICWTDLRITGWPEEVLCYSSYRWNLDDCKSLEMALKEGKIKFSFKDRGSKADQFSVPQSQKIELKERIEKLSRHIFGGIHINWKRIKSICPNLHLRDINILSFSRTDFKQLEEVAKILEGLLYLSGGELVVQTIAAAIAEGKQPKLASLKNQVYAKLLEKYQFVFPIDCAIYLSKVDIIGWPQEVIFYQKDLWDANECERLLQAMDGISFVANLGDLYRQYSSLEKFEVKRAVNRFFFKRIGKALVDWSLIKPHMPDFHLGSYRHDKWNAKDIKMIEKVLQLFGEEDLLKESLLGIFLQDCFNGDEAEGALISKFDYGDEALSVGNLSLGMVDDTLSMTDERSPVEELESLRDEIFSSLFSKYQAIQYKSVARIEWAMVQVIGWPVEVLFYGNSFWTERDCFKLKKAVKTISFQRKAYSKTKITFKPEKKRAIKGELEELSKRLFHSHRIEWRRIKELCPGLHLPHSKILDFGEEDFNKLEGVVKVLKNKAKEGSQFKSSPSSLDQFKLEKQQIYDEILAKYKQIFPDDKMINYGKVKIIGWPEEVLYYMCDCWAITDIPILREASKDISFKVTNAEVYALTKSQKEILNIRVKEFFFLHFKTKKVMWLLVRQDIRGFHLSSNIYLNWNARDAEVIESAFEHFNYNESELSKRAFDEFEDCDKQAAKKQKTYK